MNENSVSDDKLNAVIRMLEDIQSRLSWIEAPHSNNDEWLDVRAAAKYLKVSTRTLQNYRDSRLITFSQVGSKIYFRMSNLEEFLNQHQCHGK